MLYDEKMSFQNLLYCYFITEKRWMGRKLYEEGGHIEMTLAPQKPTPTAQGKGF